MTCDGLGDMYVGDFADKGVKKIACVDRGQPTLSSRQRLQSV
jgi:hypothetical protein